jgi:asparagine synthase (glutamine-hydrolysing)
MSAIFGFVRRDGGDASAEDIGRMARTLAHRGPDGIETLALDRVALGSAIMHINVEDVHESQPLRDRERGLTMVADARIDNREALAEELAIAAADLATMADSALLFACYVRWGEACVDRLLGDFTFAVWEDRTGELVLARDPMGQRGLFYHCSDSLFAFASEAKALWALDDVPRRLSEVAIGRRLLFPMDSDPGASLFEDIAILPGGHGLRLESGRAARPRSYWTPRPDPALLGKDEGFYRDAYRATMEEAVACRVRRLIRPPALCFSGGFDSGVIAAIAGPIAAAQGHKLVTVSSVLTEGDRRITGDARALIEAYRRYPFIDRRFYERGTDTPFTDAETRFAQASDPGASNSVRQGLYRIARQAGCRLILDGMGGDYTLHPRTRGLLGYMLRTLHLHRFIREFRAARRASGASVWRTYRDHVHPGLLPPRGRRRPRTSALWRTRPIQPGFAQSLFDIGAVDPARLIEGSAPTMLGRVWHRHILSRIPPQAELQRTLAAAHALEFSRPFHDRRVVELALAIPEHFEFRNGHLRGFAREAFGDRLPPELLAHGPTNLPEDPERFAAAIESLPAALADARAQKDAAGSAFRYIDLDRVERLAADPEEADFADHRRLSVATKALVLARFIAWFDRSNR